MLPRLIKQKILTHDKSGNTQTQIKLGASVSCETWVRCVWKAGCCGCGGRVPERSVVPLARKYRLCVGWMLGLSVVMGASWATMCMMYTWQATPYVIKGPSY